MFNPVEKDIAQIGEALKRGEATSVGLVRFYLDQIRQYDQQGPCVNAILRLNEKALEAAETLDEERKKGTIRSALHGIPIALKDNIDTRDMPTTAASAALSNSRPAKDAFVVQKLRQAGAIILAKNNLSEFAKSGLTVSSLMGQTRNPYDLTRTPGGSSGGTAVAVAANMAAAGVGSDTINSIRSPASANCLVGFRPTTGLLSRSGLVPCSSWQDTPGPIVRTVADAAILLDLCAGYDPDDRKTAEQVGRIHESYVEALDESGLRGKRIGLLTNNFGEDEDVTAAMERAMRVLTEQGAQLIPLNVPEFAAQLVLEQCDVQLYETKPLLNAYLKTIPGCPVEDIAQLVASGTLHESVRSDMERSAAMENPMDHPEYSRRLRRIAEKRELAYAVMAQNRLDALCYPHQQILVEPVANRSQNGRNGILASICGFPAVTAPAGFSRADENAPIGVPIGIEFMARPYEEPVLFQIAYSYEQNSGIRKPPAGFSPRSLSTNRNGG